MANAEFVLWANDELKYRNLQATIDKLQAADKVDLGLLYVAYKNKTECPQTLVCKRPATFQHTCQVCQCLLSRSDIFHSTLLGINEYFCDTHRPANIVAAYAEEKKSKEYPPCANCGRVDKYSTNPVPWVAREQLKFTGPLYLNNAHIAPYVCDKCYDILYKMKPYEKPKVKFESEDL